MVAMLHLYQSPQESARTDFSEGVYLLKTDYRRRAHQGEPLPGRDRQSRSSALSLQIRGKMVPKRRKFAIGRQP